MKVLVITTKGEYEEKEIDNNLKTLQDIVGGYIEYVDISQDGLQMIVNEEGKILDLEYNLGATLLYNTTHLYNDMILGNAIIVNTDNEGENKSITKEDIDTVKELIVREFNKGVE